MTTLKITGLSTHASTAIEPWIRRLWDDQRGRLLFVGELEHMSRTEPGPSSSTAPKVDARISLLEVPSGLNQDLIRVVMRALYLLRTARGTLDEASGAVSLDTESGKIADAVHSLFASEAAEARAVLHQLLGQLEASDTIIDEAKRRRRVRKLVEAGKAFLGTGDRDKLNALAQDALDLGDDEPVSRVQVDVETTDTASSGPVRVADVVPDVVPDPPAKPAAKKAAPRRKTRDQQQPATAGAGAE
jgi:hypothetical protein